MEIYVAKSYQGLPIVEEPYEKNKKMYCKVRLKSGKVKEVRLYTEKEYEKLYPLPEPKWAPQRKMLGFGDEGYIIIFNSKPEFEKFYSRGPFRYSRFFGWYLPGNETVPVLPDGIIPKVLPWEIVGNTDGELKEEKELLKNLSHFVRTI